MFFLVCLFSTNNAKSEFVKHSSLTTGHVFFLFVALMVVFTQLRQCWSHLLQACQQLSIFVNDRLVKSTDVELELNYWPEIVTDGEQTVLVLEAPAMPVCCFICSYQ